MSFLPVANAKTANANPGTTCSTGERKNMATSDITSGRRYISTREAEYRSSLKTSISSTDQGN
jgi:hypothetical protein